MTSNTAESNLPITPVGYRLLIEPLKPQAKYKGLIALPSETQDAQDHLMYVGRVVAMGADCYNHPKFNGKAWCEIGDYVTHGKYAGQKFELKARATDEDYVTYRLLNDDEVLAVVHDPSAVKIYV